jgi:hypothetical protein
MKKYYARALFFVMVSTLLFGCAAPQVQPTKSLFSPSQLQADQYQPKVDNFVVILDTSSSMSAPSGRLVSSPMFLTSRPFLFTGRPDIQLQDLNWP